MAKKDKAGADAPAGKKQRPSPMIARFAKIGLVYQPDVPLKDYTSPEQRKSLKVLAFSEIGTRRIRNAVKVIRQLGQLANSSSYSYTPEQVGKLEQTLTEAVQNTMNKFAKGVSEDNDALSL